MDTRTPDTQLLSLMHALSQDVATLVREEIRQARSEMGQTVLAAGKDILVMAAGGALAFAGLIEIVEGAADVLSAVMPRSLASFVAGAGAAYAGLTLVHRGRAALQHTDMLPRQMMTSLRESAEVIGP